MLLRKLASVALAFRSGLLEVIPSPRPFAISPTCNVDPADDLVRGTILRAWRRRESFQSGTNLPAWVSTGMRTDSTRSTARDGSRSKTRMAPTPLP